MTIRVLAEKGESKRQIGRTLGVGESLVRYHIKRAEDGATDGRMGKIHKAAGLAGVIGRWWEDREAEAGERPPNVQELHELLLREYGYDGSYQSVRRYVRAVFAPPKIRTYRRVETPPGAQAQTDWGEFPRVDIGDGPEDLHAFVMVLSHSRKVAVNWSRSEKQLAWLTCHNEAFLRLAGIPAVNRIDNLKTGISHGAGAWGVINATYRTYAKTVGFHIDACAPRAGNAKGKVEAKVRLGRFHLRPYERRYDGLEDLAVHFLRSQASTDRRLDRWSETAICPATGKTVQESWDDELFYLAPLPVLPVPFDIAVTRRVHRDATVSFEGRTYAVPFEHALREVEVRGCAGRVQFVAEGQMIKEYPRGTEERLLVDPACYEGEGTDRVLAPLPLGKMGRRLREIMETPVERRPIDLYAALAEVAR